MLSCGLPSHSLKTLLFARWETIEGFCLSFLHQPPNVFQQKPDRRPPQITGHRVSAVHQAGSEPLNSPRSEFTTLSLISSNEVCGEHEITTRVIHDLHEKFSSRCRPRSPREIDVVRNSGKFQEQILPNWAHRRPSRQTSAGIFGNFKLLALPVRVYNRSHILFECIRSMYKYT